MTQNTAAVIKTKQEMPYQFTRRIGNTNYNVAVHFSKTSKETISDKILRLIKSNIATAK